MHAVVVVYPSIHGRRLDAEEPAALRRWDLNAKYESN